MHRSLHIDNVRNISQSIPGESGGFHANPEYCAVPMSGSAGVIAIVQVNFCFSIRQEATIIALFFNGHMTEVMLRLC